MVYYVKLQNNTIPSINYIIICNIIIYYSHYQNNNNFFYLVPFDLNLHIHV